LGGDLEIYVDSEFVDPTGLSSGNARAAAPELEMCLLRWCLR
jgi:hypothetical protein